MDSFKKIVDPLLARKYYDITLNLIEALHNAQLSVNALPRDFNAQIQFLRQAKPEYKLELNIGALFAMAGYEIVTGPTLSSLNRLTARISLNQNLFQIHGSKKRRDFKRQAAAINEFLITRNLPHLLSLLKSLYKDIAIGAVTIPPDTTNLRPSSTLKLAEMAASAFTYNKKPEVGTGVVGT